MKTIVVLAVHGAPPRDFPRDELAEFFTLHSRLEHAVAHSPALESRYEELEEKLRAWPRTPANDPFFFASQELAAALGKASGLEVLVGCNEFCAPSLGQALEQAVAQGAAQVAVVTPMLTRGGEHAEMDIAQAIARARARYPDVRFVYAWPFATDEITRFLAAHLARFLQA